MCMGYDKWPSDVGYVESEHTADLALEVRGTSLPALFINSARGMFFAIGARIKKNARFKNYHIEIHGLDAETLLVNFLSELLYIHEKDGVGFSGFQVALEENTLLADVTATALHSTEKHIKAVTYHDLAIRHGTDGYTVKIVFDI